MKMKSPSVHSHHHHGSRSSSNSGSNSLFPSYFESLIMDGSTSGNGNSILDLAGHATSMYKTRSDSSSVSMSMPSSMTSLSPAVSPPVHSHSHSHYHSHHHQFHSHPSSHHFVSSSSSSASMAWPSPSSSSPISPTISPSYLYSSASQFQPMSDLSESSSDSASYLSLSSSSFSSLPSASSSISSSASSPITTSYYSSESPFATSLLHYFHQGIDHINVSLSDATIVSGRSGTGTHNQIISEAMASVQSAPAPPTDYFANSTASYIIGSNVTGGGDDPASSAKYTEIDLYTMRNVMLIFCYSLIVLVSLSGNLLVCRVTLFSKEMKTTTNLLIGSLACSDLVMTVFNIPFNLFRMLPISWPFGMVMCILVPLIQTTCVYVSTFTMTLIALHRFWTVRSKRSTHGKTSGLKVFLMILAIWMIAVTFSLPHAAFNRLRAKRFEGHTLSRCMAQHPKMGFNFPLFLTVEVFVTQYLLPLSITMVVYIKIAQIIAKQGALICKLSDEKKRRQSEAKRRRIFMLALAVATFATCWAPIDIYFLLFDMKLVPFSEPIYILCHWFAMSSVCYNPIIYCWLNEKFRIGAKQTIRSICNIPLLNSVDKPHNSI